MNDGINLAVGIALQSQDNSPEEASRPYICILSIVNRTESIKQEVKCHGIQQVYHKSELNNNLEQLLKDSNLKEQSVQDDN